MEKYSVSVIIPVYGVAPYIEKCARSIFEQTLESLEILFINDCTPDNSVEIIKKTLANYPNRIPNTKIISLKKNSGLPSARAKGISEASGQYIIHCDGDDWVDHTLYQTMYESAVANNSDIVMSDEIWEYSDKSIPDIIDNILPTGKDILANFPSKSMGFHVHNKLTRKSLYMEFQIMPWKGINMWEDIALFSRLFYYAKNIAKVENVFYHYNRANVSSITANYGITAVNQMIDVASRLTDFFYSKEDGKRFTKFVDTLKYQAKLNLITDSFKSYRRYKKIFPESDYIKKELTYKMFSAKGKLRFSMVKLGLAPLFIVCFKLKNLFKI